MSNQPQKERVRKKGEYNLLERLLMKNKVELGMEIQGKHTMFKLLGMSNGKIYISTNDDFLSSANTIDEAFVAMGKFENIDPSYYDASSIKTTYVADDEEQQETKIREIAMPQKPTSKNSVKMWGKVFYIVKKSPSGKSSGRIFCLYNWHTRNLLWAHWDRDVLIGWLAMKYKEIEHKDI